jgi:hypothetical protein
MMWHARLKPLVAVAAAVILATAAVAVQGRQQPAAERAREQGKTAPSPKAGGGGAAAPNLPANQALAREQLALIDNALQILDRMYQDAKTSLSDPSFSVWRRRRLETLRKTGAGKAEMVAALEKYLDSLKKDEAMAEAMHQSGRGTRVDVYDVQFRRMEAEIWLNEEKAK